VKSLKLEKKINKSMARPARSAPSVRYVSKKKAKKVAHLDRLSRKNDKAVELSNRQMKKQAREAKLAESMAANISHSFNNSVTGGTTLGDALSHTMWF